MWLSGTGGACNNCPGGKYTVAGTDASRNVQCDACSSGKFLLANIANVQSNDGYHDCKNCPAGQYHAQTGASCFDCAAGQYQAVAAQTQACTTCEAGKYQTRTVLHRQVSC